MILKKLKERTFLVKGTPLPERAKNSYANRRDSKGITMVELDSEIDKFDTFFDYEDDLANLKPSSEQYAEMINEDPYVVLEEKEEELKSDFSSKEISQPIVMEFEINDENQEGKAYTDVVGFEFVQCSYIKSDDKRCKRQAPKGEEICSIHKKHILKHGY